LPRRISGRFRDNTPCIEAVAPGFSSITACDSATGFTTPNPIGRYVLGGDDELAANAV
jgi:hypothetical protein